MVSLTQTFREGFDYAKQDYRSYLIIGIFGILLSLSSVLSQLGLKNSVVFGVASIISFIFSLIIWGYELRVIKENIEGNDILPEFSFEDDLVGGIKLFVLQIIYFIIPVIIICITAGISLIGTVSKYPNLNITNVSSLTSISPNVLYNVLGALTFTIIIGVILFIIFGLLSMFGQCRLAKTNSLREGISFSNSYNELRKAGILHTLGWIILLIIIMVVIGIVGSIINLIPFVGVIISSLLIFPLTILLVSSALGKYYKYEILEE
ncbi:MAG: DUF4013 domain-containing protein [Methanobrevibacter sp.]